LLHRRENASHAVIIAIVGIAGVLAFSVNSRANEIGIRMSLGADSSRVQRMILREGGVLPASDSRSAWTVHSSPRAIIRGLLFGVEPNDSGTLTVVALMMAAVGIAACWMPALRASTRLSRCGRIEQIGQSNAAHWPCNVRQNANARICHQSLLTPTRIALICR
jgi:hypothetical protein